VLDAMATNDCVIVDDLADDPRWPRFGSLTFEKFNVRSVAAYRLYLRRGPRAALLFLSDWPSAFDEMAIALGTICAAYGALIQPDCDGTLVPPRAEATRG